MIQRSQTFLPQNPMSRTTLLTALHERYGKETSRSKPQPRRRTRALPPPSRVDAIKSKKEIRTNRSSDGLFTRFRGQDERHESAMATVVSCPQK